MAISMQKGRMVVDCRDAEGDCAVTISGTEGEVMKVAYRHAVEDHGFQDNEDTKKAVVKMMKKV